MRAGERSARLGRADRPRSLVQTTAVENDVATWQVDEVQIGPAWARSRPREGPWRRRRTTTTSGRWCVAADGGGARWRARGRRERRARDEQLRRDRARGCRGLARGRGRGRGRALKRQDRGGTREEAREEEEGRRAQARRHPEPRPRPRPPAPAPAPGPRDAPRRSRGGRASTSPRSRRARSISPTNHAATRPTARTRPTATSYASADSSRSSAPSSPRSPRCFASLLSARFSSPLEARGPTATPTTTPTTTRRRRGRSPRSIPPRTRPRPPPRNRRTVPRNRRTVPRPPKPPRRPRPRPRSRPGPVPAASGPSVASEYGRLSAAGALGTWTHGKDARDRAMVPAAQRAVVSAGDPRSIGELARCCAVQGDAIVVGGWDGTVRRWRWTRDGSALVGGAPLQGHSDKVEFASASPIVFGDGDGTGTRDRGDGRSRLVSDHVGSVPRVSRGRETRARVHVRRHRERVRGLVREWAPHRGGGHPWRRVLPVGRLRGSKDDDARARRRDDGGGDVRPGRRASVRVRWRGRHRQGMGPAPIRAGSYPEWSPSTRLRARGRRGRRSLRWRFRRRRDRVAQPSTRGPFPRDDSYSERAARRRRFGSYRGASVRSRGGHRGRRGDAHLHRRSVGDDDDAPEGAVHARVVDATGGWSNTSEHSETFEGASDDAHAGGYLFTLPTEEGLLSCAGASEDASTVAAGTVDGALVAWRRRGGSAGSARSALAEWAGDQGRWPVVDAEVTQEGCAVLDGESESDDDEA